MEGANMTTDQMITMIISILVPMFCGFGWIINRMFKFEERISGDLRSLDSRLSRIEGYLEGRNSVSKNTGTDH